MADYNENRKFQSVFLKWQTSVPTEHNVYAYHEPSHRKSLVIYKTAHVKHQKQTNKTKKQLKEIQGISLWGHCIPQGGDPVGQSGPWLE